MTTINTIEDLARILRDQPTWAEALRALLLTQDLLDLPGRFDRFVETQQETNRLTERRLQAIEGQLGNLQGGFDRFVEAQLEFNQAQQETNRLTDQRLQAVEGQLNSLNGRMGNLEGRMGNLEGRMGNLEGRMGNLEGRMGNLEGRMGNLEGRMGNLEGGQYERTIRTRALARSMIVLGFEAPYVALNQEGLTDPRLNSAVDRAIRNGLVSQDGYADLFEADLIISAEDNRHAVVEVSITADEDDINRSKARAGILTAITEGAVTPIVITFRLNPAQAAQAEAAGVTTLVMPYP